MDRGVKRRPWKRQVRQAIGQGRYHDGQSRCATGQVRSSRGLALVPRLLNWAFFVAVAVAVMVAGCWSLVAGLRGVNGPSSADRRPQTATRLLHVQPITPPTLLSPLGPLLCVGQQPSPRRPVTCAPTAHLMSKPLVHSATSLRPIHLLRALLREATYLPDAVARSYFRRYIVNRFKAYQPKEKATATFDVGALQRCRDGSFKGKKAAIIRERTRPLLKKGQKGLNFLRRANLGEQPCLTKVLCFAYGRLGRRKYALLNKLLRPEASTCGDEPQPTPLQQLYHSNKRYLQYFDAPTVTHKTRHTIKISPRYARLQAVVRSQHERGISLNRALKTSQLVTPINNVWERPMPIRRARNNVKRWYAETLTRLLPPLPTEMWDEMRAMKDGEKKASLIRRRTPAASVDSSFQNEGLRSLEILQAGIAMDRPSRADKPVGMQRPHLITQKFMRRLYSRILALCCKLQYDQDQMRWNVIWDESKNSIHPNLCTVPPDESLFAGVDTSGLVLKPPKPPKIIQTERNLMPLNAKGERIRFPFFTEFLPDGHPLKRNLDKWKQERAAAEAASGGEQRTSRSRPP